MRVLHVYSGNLYGGIETLLATLARHQDTCQGMTLHFALCFEGQLSRELRAAGAVVACLGEVRLSRPATVWRSRRALAELLSQGEVDVVVCHSGWSQAIFGSTVRSAGLPLVFWLHNAVSGANWPERWARLIRPDLAICNSQFTATILPRLYSGVPHEVVYCAVAPPRFRYSDEERNTTRAEYGAGPGVAVIIQVGRLEDGKGHRLHLEALHKLRDVPNWICWQVGGAQQTHEIRYRDELRRTADELGIGDRIRFLGTRTDVDRLLAAADIYCQPNTQPDSFGITFIEALYAALPIVTTAMGGAKEIVNGSCGFLIEPENSVMLADTLRSLVRDPVLRARLGAAGPERARALSDPTVHLTRVGELFTNTFGVGRAV